MTDFMLWLGKGEAIGLFPKNTWLSGGFFFVQKLEDKKRNWGGVQGSRGDRPKR